MRSAYGMFDIVFIQDNKRGSWETCLSIDSADVVKSMGSIKSGDAYYSKLLMLGFKKVNGIIDDTNLVFTLCIYRIGSKIFSLKLYVNSAGDCRIYADFLRDDVESIYLRVNKDVSLSGFDCKYSGFSLWIPAEMLRYILNLYSLRDFRGIMRSLGGYFDVKLHEFYINIMDFEGELIDWC